jgi:CDP-L-myo-inositol myo-inositolphosphotransferase
MSVTATTELAPAPGDLWFAGEALLSADSILEAIRANGDGMTHSSFALEAEEVLRFHAKEGPLGLDDLLYKSSKQIIRDTVKHSDGIVSRHFNRPISTRITGVLLQGRTVRPVHATAVAALTAVLMFLCLISGTHAGLIAGAILFQVASVIDGVDGEIARATFRTSRRGATLDSLADAATNLAFLVGLSLSLAQQGFEDAEKLGMMGFACLSTGLVLLGIHATLSGRPINFDALKHIVKQHQSPLADWVVWLTMRDFLALASAAMVVLGLGHTFLQLFVLGSGLWLLTVVVFGSLTFLGYVRR